MQYSIIVHGTHKTSTYELRKRKQDDSDYSYQQYAMRNITQRAKELYDTIKLELVLDGAVEYTTYGKIKKVF